MKCSWALDRSLRLAALHFLMNSVGVIDTGYPGDVVRDVVRDAIQWDTLLF
jgi:dUTPase